MTDPTVLALWVGLGGGLGALAGWLTPSQVARLPEREPVEGGPPGAEPATDRHPHGRYVDLDTRSARLPLAVIGAAVGGVLAGARAGEVDVVAFLLLGVLGTAMGYVDVRLHLLPDRLTVPALLGCAVLLLPAVLLGTGGPGWDDYARAWAGAGALLLAYLVLALINPAGLGLGDVKLAASLGLMLAWLSWGILALGALLGFLIGGLVAVALLLAGRAGRRTAVPFGPSMLLGALIAIGWGEAVLAWYMA